jgi:hypothetical protein
MPVSAILHPSGRTALARCPVSRNWRSVT